MNVPRARQVLVDSLGVVAPDVEFDLLDPGDSLRDQAGLDSIDFLELVAQLARATDADIPEDDYPHLDTVDSAVAYLAPRLD